MSLEAGVSTGAELLLDENGLDDGSLRLKLDTYDSSDVQRFENMLHSDPFADSVFGKFSDFSDTLSNGKIEFERSLKRAADTSKPTDILDAMRSLSEYSLQTAMVAKVAGKTSQSIEKLTNLQ